MTRVALITGAAGGVGAAVCRRLAGQGFALVLVDRGTDSEGRGADAEPLRALAQSLASNEVVTLDADLSSPASAERVVDEAHARFGRLDAVISLAGFRRERSLLKLQDEDLRETLDVHLVAPLALLRAAAQRWIDLGSRGSVILATNATAFFGASRHAAASAASAGLAAAIRAAAGELRRHRICVNAVAPTARTRLTEGTPLFRKLGPDAMRAEDVAPLIAWLARAETEVSGEILGVAGGRIYALQNRETTGAFSESTAFDESEISRRWDEIIRG